MKNEKCGERRPSAAKDALRAPDFSSFILHFNYRPIWRYFL